jgi:SMC interacting uncharacterized protein involved in chromosome segregation
MANKIYYKIMEKEMSALQKLQEKIEQWKDNHEALKAQNDDLKSQLSNAQGATEAKDALNQELEAATAKSQTQEETIVSLQRELTEKDEEIEKIITQVEALLA